MNENPAIYGQYMQKSYAFLFPLLELKRKGEGVFAPDQTYLSLQGLYKPYDLKLIASYRNHEHNASWQHYQQHVLLSHYLLDTTTETHEGRKMLYIFDLSKFESDFKLFLTGNYSDLSIESKKKLCSYYGIHSSEWAYMEGYLWPNKSRKHYALQMGIDVQDLEGKQLCAPYDAVQETLRVDLPDDFVDQLVLT